jgi:hypothetical protein
MRRALTVTLAVAGVLASLLSLGFEAAQASDPAPVTRVTIDAVGSSGVSGLAILSATDAGTAVQVLAVGAPPDATAIIHAGSCAAIDPAPVGLLGNVGGTGVVQATLPLALTSLADGGHVIALHPGLDLASVLSCGVIPATTEVTPTQGSSPAPASPGVASNSYQSPTFGFSVHWGPAWQPMASEPQAGIESVLLQDGVSSVSFAGHRSKDGVPAGCVSDWEGRLLAALRQGQIANLGPVTAAGGQPVSGADDQRARGAYRYDVKAGDKAGSAVVEAMDCRRLSADAVLEILQVSPETAFAAEAVLVQGLLSGLSLGQPMPSSSAEPSAPTPAPVAPTPAPVVPTPAPSTPAAASPTADCAAVGAWLTATQGRLDRLTAIGNDVAAAMSGGMDAYAKQLAASAGAVQNVLVDAQGAPVPASAVTLDKDLQDAMALLVSAYDTLADAYRTGNATELQDGISKAGQVEQKVTAVRSGMRDLATPCGLRVPSA